MPGVQQVRNPWAWVLLVVLLSLIWIVVRTAQAGNLGVENEEKSLWDWAELLIVPIALALGAYWLDHRTGQLERMREQRQENQRKKGLIVQMGTSNNKIALQAYKELSEIASFKDGVLHGADLREANLSGASFLSADLREANLSGAILLLTNLRNTDLRGALLQGAQLAQNPELSGSAQPAVLQDADLRATYLRYVNLVDANLRDANLSEANLMSADLRGADLRGADLTNTKLGSNVKTNLQTQWPENFEPEKAGVKLVK